MESPERDEFYSINNADAQRMLVSVRRAGEWVGYPYTT